jgi:hypothetical protein
MLSQSMLSFMSGSPRQARGSSVLNLYSAEQYAASIITADI